jgi:hypothetical protein
LISQEVELMANPDNFPPKVTIVSLDKKNPPTERPVKKVDEGGNAALLALLKVEAEARECRTESELVFLIANEIRKLTRARQVFVLRQRTYRRLSVEAVNSLDSVDRNSPLIRWIERMVMRLKKQEGLADRQQFSLPAYCAKDEEETKTYPFKEMVWLPFTLKDDTIFGGVLMSREQPWTDADLVIARRLAETFSHAWAAISGTKRLRSRGRTRKVLVAAALSCIAIAMAIPVPIAALAPAEIVAAQPYIVTAPIDGVIADILVTPNVAVTKNQPILKFVDVTLRNKLAVAEREISVARSQLKRYSQSAFDDPEAKRELRTAMSQLQLKQAEMSFAKDLLGKSVIKAGSSGMVVFNGKNEWIGKPVRVGQAIMEIADPSKVQLKISLSVDDAIVVDKNARVRVYLDSDPLHPRNARVIRSAHEARKTSSDVLAYEIIAELEDTKNLPRLGVRGTAQVFGDDAPVFFYLFRRPLSALRQKLGM